MNFPMFGREKFPALTIDVLTIFNAACDTELSSMLTADLGILLI